MNVSLVRTGLDLSFATANRLVEQMESLRLLEETTGGRRNRVYRYSPYLALFAEEEHPKAEPMPVQTTEARG